MLFRAARCDALVADDPAEFVETVRQRDPTERRPITLDELRAVPAVADEEWKSRFFAPPTLGSGFRILRR